MLWWLEKPLEIKEAVKNAQGKWEAWHLANIRQQADRDWRASGWSLERIKPERYAKRDSLQHLGTIGHLHAGVIEHSVTEEKIGAAKPELRRDLLKAITNGTGNGNRKETP